ncbi:hypothetical protein D3C80_1909520 [compost metagenome]
MVYQADAVVEAAGDDGSPVPDTVIVNGTSKSRLVLELLQEWGPVRLEVFNCTGEAVASQIRILSPGLHSIPVPPSGTLRLQFCQTEESGTASAK